MNDRNMRILEMWIRVQALYTEQRNILGNIESAEQQFAIINEVIEEVRQMAQIATSSSNNAKQQTTNKTALKENIENRLERIRRTAKAIALTKPGIDEKFPASKNNGNRALVASAMSAYTEARGMRDDFIKLGMEQDFIESLQSTVQAFELSLSTRAKAKDLQIGAGAAARPLIDKGSMAVKVLDAIVHNIFHNDPAMLARWDKASRIQQSPGPSTKKKPKPPPTSPSTPTN